MSDKDASLIHLQGNGYEQYFGNRDELHSFLHGELTNWRWIRTTLGTAGGQIFQTHTHAPISTVINLANINPRINFSNYLSSQSADGLFIEAIRKHHGDTIGLLTYIYLHPEKQSLLRNHVVKQALSNPEHFYESSLAALITAKYKGDLDSTSSIAETSISETINDIAEHSKQAKQTISSITSSHEEELYALKSDRKKLLTNWNNQIRRRFDLYGRIAKSVRSDARSQLTLAKGDVDAAKAAYHDTIDLEASVTYWVDRKQSHIRGKYGWLLAVAIIMFITGLGLSSYYSHGGIIGISSQSPDTLTTPGIDLGIDQGDRKIVNLTGAGLIITFFWVFLRIALKQFNTHASLAIEASERVTMTKTYLALLAEGKLNGDQDRKLVLEALFKSSQLTPPTSESATTPVELIIKAITEKRA